METSTIIEPEVMAKTKASNKKQAIFTLVAAILIQLVVGVAYIWSVFQNGIAKSLFSEGIWSGSSQAFAQLAFSVLLAMLSIGSVVGGKLVPKFGLKMVVFIGGVIFAFGFTLAGTVSSFAPWALWLTYGVLGGFGMGFTYSTTIAAAQKWFPHKKGLVTGLIVSALGFGGVIFTPIAESLIKIFGGVGVGESNTFIVFAGIILVVCCVGSFFLKLPPEAYSPALPVNAKTKKTFSHYKGSELTTKEMLKKPEFYIITGTLMIACMGGLMMIGFAKPIAIAKGLGETAWIGVMIVAICNSMGRLTCGIISDKIGRINTIIIVLAGTAAVAPFVVFVGGYWIFALIALIGFCYGGLLSNFPSLTGEQFGAKNIATNYGIVLLGFGIGAIVSSQIAGVYREKAAMNIVEMFPAFMIAAACALAGIGLMFLLKFLNKRANNKAEAAEQKVTE